MIDSTTHKRIPLLVVCRFSGTGGAERTLLPFVEKLHDFGFDPTLFFLTHPTETALFSSSSFNVVGACSTIETKLGFWSRIKLLYRLFFFIKRSNVVIATSELSATYIPWFISRLFSIPFVADVQLSLKAFINDNCNGAHHVLCRLVYPHIRYIRAVSRDIAAELNEYYHVDCKHIRVIPVSIDIAKLKALASIPLPSEWNYYFAKPTIISVGRLTRQKRFDVALEAFAHVHRQYKGNINFVIIGEGEQEHYLRNRINELGLRKNVFIAGYKGNPYPFMSRASVFLLCSDYEGLPRVLIEALALGVPCVSTDCPTGPREILDNGRFGLLAKTGDVSSISTALSKVLNDLELATNMKREGMLRAKIYDKDFVIDQYVNLIHEAVRA